MAGLERPYQMSYFQASRHSCSCTAALLKCRFPNQVPNRCLSAAKPPPTPNGPSTAAIKVSTVGPPLPRLGFPPPTPPFRADPGIWQGPEGANPSPHASLSAYRHEARGPWGLWCGPRAGPACCFVFVCFLKAPVPCRIRDGRVGGLSKSRPPRWGSLAS
jgi:hypothetical protein